jgi:hypothetical protein
MGAANNATSIVTLIIFDPNSYGSGVQGTIDFAGEAEARAFALKYQGAFRRHVVFLVHGRAELLEAPPAPAKKDGRAELLEAPPAPAKKDGAL